MPATKRKGRKQSPGARKMVEKNTLESSPHHRAAKRRRVSDESFPQFLNPDIDTVQTNGAAAEVPIPQAPPVEDSDDDDAEDSDETMSNAEAQEVADRVIPLLAVARHPINVATEHANEQYDGETAGAIQAYAKVCGASWTYYINSTNVNIGRNSEQFPRHSMASRAGSSPGEGPEGPGEIHIDMGPHKHVSRLHGNLYFEGSDARWHIHVVGRNGIKVNHIMLRRGQHRVIGCGDILEMAGTQMMFVTANEKAVIHESFLRKLQDETSEDEALEEAATNRSITAHGLHSQNSLEHDVGNGMLHMNGTTNAPAPSNFVRPTTPVRSAKKAGAPPHSPTLGGAGELETNEDIDYSLDAYKDFKPSCSYSCMIGRAILSTRDESMTLAGIYKWISANFAYYRHNKTNWKNSIRHNLSIHDQFQKIPRRSDEPGKGMKWSIPAHQRPKVIAEIQKQQGRGGKFRSRSTPSSPTVRVQDPSIGAPSLGQAKNLDLKGSPSTRSPPLSSYPPTAQESYTPSRGSRLTAFGNNTTGAHGLPNLSSDDPAPLPVRQPHASSTANLGSSPTLTSGAWLGYDANSMRTPLPRPHNLNIPLPNTIAKPSSYMPDSSPAPFWKYTRMTAGSTPGIWPGESSPLKPPALPSSSPPPPLVNGVDSPTKARGAINWDPRVGSDPEDEEEGGIDLAKGFQNISYFHKRRQEAAAAAQQASTVS